MKYSISDIANLLGITPVSVRNYEKSGLIEPERNEKNNYREYNAIDLNLIRRARLLMNYGYSLSEATDLIRNKDLKGMSAAMHAKEAELERQLMLDYQKLSLLRQRADYMQRVSVESGECTIEMSPDLFGFLYRDGEQFYEDEPFARNIRLWNSCPFAETLVLVSAPAFARRKMIYRCGLCVSTRHKGLIDTGDETGTICLPPRPSVYCHTTSQIESDHVAGYFPFSHVVDWMEQRGLTPKGDIVSRVLHTSHSTGEWLHHIEIWVPIQ